jgi:hypothetical protein
MGDLDTLYDQNYAEWAKANADLLRRGKFSQLDIDHLVEELEDMGRSERNELESRLLVWLAHLLKWQFQYQKLSDPWREFKGRQLAIDHLGAAKANPAILKKSSGLKSVLTEAITDAYPDAVELATEETDLPRDTFPEACPYALEELLDSRFFPPT